MSKLRILAGSIAIASLAACQRQQPAADEHMAHMSPGDVALPAVAASNQQGDLSLPPSARTAAARLAGPDHAVPGLPVHYALAPPLGPPGGPEGAGAHRPARAARGRQPVVPAP